MMRPGIDGRWIRTIDGKLTFCGALEECYDECSRNWRKSTTREQYDRDYNDRILPFLADHDGRSIDQYTIEDYEAAIAAIERRGTERTTEFVPYAESTIQHFRHLIRVVVKAAAKKGLCADVLWGSYFSLPENTDTEYVHKERAMIRKSMTPQEELTVAKKLFEDPAQKGEYMGLLLMFALGLRNGEACGADYGDIRPMLSAPGSKALWVYKSTKAGKRELQSSGKTRNADRVLPIPDTLAEFMQKRRSHIAKELMQRGEDASDAAIDRLPVACVGDRMDERCSASHLTAAGRELFKSIKMREERLSYTEEELMQEIHRGKMQEKDPTAYLFRRNFGTHLHILGLSEAEIEYVVGHDIEDLYETRNEFVNEEKLLLIRDKLSMRPIFNRPRAVAIDISASPHSGKIGEANRYRFAMRQGKIRLHFEAKENHETLRIKLNLSPDAAPVMRRLFAGTILHRPGRTIDILKKYREIYENTMK